MMYSGIAIYTYFEFQRKTATESAVGRSLRRLEPNFESLAPEYCPLIFVVWNEREEDDVWFNHTPNEVVAHHLNNSLGLY